MRAFSSAFVSLLAIVPLVLSTPIPVWRSTVVNQPAVNDEASQARVAAYHEADARAKEMVSKMVIVANSDKPEHKKIVNDAFGPNANQEKIKATIHKLNTQQVQIDSTDVATFKGGEEVVAVTPVDRPNGFTKPIKLGASFFAADSSKDFRAGTLIHEATHQQSHTGDRINTNNKIVGALESQKKDIKFQDNGHPHVGYHFPGAANHKTVPTLAADLSEKYQNNRDHVVKNMEDNADSYRVFAHFCSQPGVARRDIELFGRALLEADADDHFYLAKRNSCALPKDYFKKKAAAKAAGASKGTKSIKPASHLTKGATTKGPHAHAVSKAGRKPSAPKALKGAAKRVSRVASLGRTSQKSASGVKFHASTKSKARHKPFSPKALKGAAERVSHIAFPGRTSQKSASGVKSYASTMTKSKAGHKPFAPKALKGAAKRVSRVAFPGRTSRKGASGVTSHALTKPISRAAKENLKRTSRSSPKAAHKSVANALSGTIKRVTSSQRAQAKVNHVAQKKVAAALPKKSTPHAAPPKKAGKK